MADLKRWIAEVGPDGKLSSRSYNGFEDTGSEGVRQTSEGETFYAISRNRDEAESRVQEMWERRVEE